MGAGLELAVIVLVENPLTGLAQRAVVPEAEGVLLLAPVFHFPLFQLLRIKVIAALAAGLGPADQAKIVAQQLMAGLVAHQHFGFRVLGQHGHHIAAVGLEGQGQGPGGGGF